jgi:8-oxo-dGTP diphosphatase
MRTIIELLRHAKAGRRDEWGDACDRERPLSDEGRAQADRLTSELAAGGPIAALYTSPLLRCRQTLEPLAETLGLPLVQREAFAEAPGVPVVDAGSLWVASAWLGGRAVALLDELVATHPGQRVVCCSHGDVLPSLLALLAGRDGVAVTDTHLRKGARAGALFERGRCVDVECLEAPHAASAPSPSTPAAT